MVSPRKEQEIKCQPVAGLLSNVELERLEPAADGGTAGAFPSRSVLLHQDFYAGMAEPADAFRTCVRIFEPGDASASSTVDLDVLRRKAGRRVRQALGAHVEVLATFAAFDGGERVDCVLVI